MSLPHEHQDHFALLRMVAATLVLYSHQHALTGLPEPGVIGVHSFGGLGVVMFFAISGFLVAQSWQTDPHLLRFAWRRLLRIWPAFAVAVLLCVAVLGPLLTPLAWGEYWHDPRTSDYLKNLVFCLRGALPLSFEGNSLPFAINGSLWTIPLELQCYAVLAALGLAGALRRAWLVTLMAVALSVFYAGWQLRGEWLVQRWSLVIEQQYFIEFGAAFLIGVSLRLQWPWASRHLLALSAGALALGVLAFAQGRPVLSFLLVVPLVTIVFGVQSWPVLRRFDRWGDLSFGTYLYAFPTQQTLIWASGAIWVGGRCWR
ncbi:MAG: acyltransferase [Inhella sp.]